MKESAVNSNVWKEILTKAVNATLHKAKPRREADFRMYLRENRAAVTEEAQSRWAAMSDAERENNALIAVKCTVAKEWLEGESEDVKKDLQERIEADYQERQAEYELRLKGVDPTEDERKKCVRLLRVVMPN